MAASSNKDQVVEFLIERNVDVCACNEDGETALHYAAEGYAHEGVLTALIKAGAKVDARDKLGKTPLHYAATTDCPGTVRVLLESGADPNPKTGDGRTPRELARRDTRALFP
jgi:ankyrin repeat protein